ncbi:hypothetical protein ILYODFUR_038803 [Ilyodon furcidens]|uniref:Uncharacterized protein n=1 Tax=Ilyodon furcidens TaxID=33524 RepID=A0ABV0VN34_9TELE
MSSCQQRDISALSRRPASHGVWVEEKGPLERGCFYTASGIMGSPLLNPPFPNVGSRLNAIYFESSRKVCTASFMLQSMPVGFQHGEVQNSCSVQERWTASLITQKVTLSTSNRATIGEIAHFRAAVEPTREWEPGRCVRPGTGGSRTA